MKLLELSTKHGFLLAGGLLLGAWGCGSNDSMTSSEQETEPSSVSIAITTVPTSAQCIRVTATPTSGSATVKTFTVTAGSSSTNLQLGTLAAGNYTLAGDAFNVACTSISGTGNWIADSQTITVKTGITLSPTMTFRKMNPISVNANFVSNVQSIATSIFSTFVATDTGVFQNTGYGAKLFTKLNLTAFDSSTTPGNAVASIAATQNGFCAVRVDGTVWCWGGNTYGELGPGIAIGSTNVSAAVQVPNLAGVTQIAANYYHVCAIGAYSGASGVYCWGYNAYGELGNNTTTNSSTPVLALNSYAKSVSCGFYSSYAVDNTGQVRAWGYNGYGQLGNNSTVDSKTPVWVSGEAPAQSVTAGGYHACSLRVDGSAHCWGVNWYGNLGNNTTTNSSIPVTVSGLTAKQISGNTFGACAINTANQTVCWGDNSNGTIGDGTNITRLVPTAVALNGVTLTSLSTTPWTDQCGISTTQDMYCWGFNQYGNLGDGTSNTAYYPVKSQLQ